MQYNPILTTFLAYFLGVFIGMICAYIYSYRINLIPYKWMILRARIRHHLLVAYINFCLLKNQLKKKRNGKKKNGK